MINNINIIYVNIIIINTIIINIFITFEHRFVGITYCY